MNSKMQASDFKDGNDDITRYFLDEFTKETISDNDPQFPF
jgi:hypothetical protein